MSAEELYLNNYTQQGVWSTGEFIDYDPMEEAEQRGEMAYGR